MKDKCLSNPKKSHSDHLSFLFSSRLFVTYINILDDGGVKSSVEGMRRMRFPRIRFEQVLNPPPSISQPLPQAVCVHLPLYQLLPQHPLGDDPQPLLADQLSCAQRPGVQEGEDVLSHMVQTLKIFIIIAQVPQHPRQ